MSESTPSTRGVAILGSTGSIGTQALEVIREQSHALHVEVLTAHRNADLLIAQALEFKPNTVVIGDVTRLGEVKDALWEAGIKVYGGPDALEQVVEMDGIHVVLTALVGAAGLRPTLRAIRARKTIALANKETLVVAGALVMEEARAAGVDIHPVDSEHSAIYQCLAGEILNPIEKVILTASGGPFRGKSREELLHVTKAQALASELGHGRQNHHRQRIHDEQRPRSHRSPMALRRPHGPNRSRRASSKYCSQLRAIRRRLDQGAARASRYEIAHSICFGLSQTPGQYF